MKKTQHILIVGGGLSGLMLAYLLSKRNRHVTVLEASERLGGRIQTIFGPLQTPMELGATWFSDRHPHLLSLIGALGLQTYPQFAHGISLFQTKSFEPPQKFFVPEAENPSYRLVGGTQMLIDTLAEKLPKESVLLNTTVTGVREAAEGIYVDTDSGMCLEAARVILCVPPQLAAEQISFSPALPDEVRALLPMVQTWMAGALKFTLEYDRPFWRNEGYSGMVYSHAGIVTEMYDHTDAEKRKFGFTGFLQTGAAAYSREIRRQLVLGQLGNLFGTQAQTPTAYFDKVWTGDGIGAGNPAIQHPHQHHGHPLLQRGYLHDKLFFAATETATAYPGYMEGAVIAAKHMADKLV